MKYFVEVIERHGNKKVIKRMGPFPERKSEKIETGINFNLNQEKYYTRIVEE